MAGRDAILGAARTHADDFLAPKFAEMNASPHTHAGIDRPERKKSVLVRIDRRSQNPIPKTKTRYTAMMTQSMVVRFMLEPAKRIANREVRHADDRVVAKVPLFNPKSRELASAFAKEGRSASWRVLQSAACRHQPTKPARASDNGKSGGIRSARSG